MENLKGVLVRTLSAIYVYVKKNLLLVLTVFAVLLSLLIGLGLKRVENISEPVLISLQFPGDLFMNMLKMLVLPLIAASLITGVAQLDPKISGVIGKRAMIYYLLTTIIAVCTGIVLVLIIRPGNMSLKPIDSSLKTKPSGEKVTTTLDTILDLIRNLVPENLIRACFQTQKTRYVSEPATFEVNENNSMVVKNVTYKRVVAYEDNMNTLGIIMFSIFFGGILCILGDSAEVVIEFVSVMDEAIMKFIYLILWYSPIGIGFLLLAKILSIKDLDEAAKQLAFYMLTVILGLVIHAFITLPAIYFAFTRRNPFVFMKGMLQALVTALATASSSAALPFTFQCAEVNNGVDRRITRFILPIGATINMDGTALYEAVAAIFIAGINGISLSFGEIVTISVTATLASIGAASIPGAGLITMIMVLNSVNLPVSDIAVILPVDWILDRLRTTVNVLGDAFGAGLVYHISKDELDKADNARNDNPGNATGLTEQGVLGSYKERDVEKN